MMGGANPSPAWRIYADTDFDADAFIGEAEKLFSNLCTGENRIRSGNYIPKGCKSVISSYRLLARHTAEDGEGRVDVIHIKLAPGVTCSEAEEKTVGFLTKYMRDSGSGGVFAAITAARGQGWTSMFLESPSLCGIFIPDDILDFIASQGIKNYLHKSCGVSF
ncbi:MAG: hypothetical protein HUJ86_07400, partial [Synergistes sp.]|nr:hypothetical protein [Synergistes sp.]